MKNYTDISRPRNPPWISTYFFHRFFHAFFVADFVVAFFNSGAPDALAPHFAPSRASRGRPRWWPVTWRARQGISRRGLRGRCKSMSFKRDAGPRFCLLGPPCTTNATSAPRRRGRARWAMVRQVHHVSWVRRARNARARHGRPLRQARRARWAREVRRSRGPRRQARRGGGGRECIPTKQN